MISENFQGKNNLKTDVFLCQEIKFVLLKFLYGRGGRLTKNKERRKP